MKHDIPHDRTSPLFAELRRFVAFRWFAGVIVIMAAVANSYWQGWTDQHFRALLIGTAVLGYNLVLWVILWQYRADRHSRATLQSLAWIQILLDMFCLTLLVVWTGGLMSPLLGLFVLHMVFASTLLSPRSAFAAAGAAVVFVSLGLVASGQWPRTQTQTLIGVGGIVTLLFTVHLTNHIAQSLRRRETEVSDRNRRIRAILDTAADGIITINDDSTIVSVNPAAERIFGYKAGELVGEDLKILVPEPYRSEHAGYIRDYLRTGQSKIIGVGREVVGQRKDGTVFPLDAAVSVVPLDDGLNFTAIVRDISERKESESTLRQLNEELKRQQRALIQSEKMAAMGQMAAGVAHEIANPLASMDSLLQLAMRKPERLNEQTVGTLREQIERIRVIVQQMTDFAHPNETGWERVKLNDVVAGALEMIRFDHRIRKVEVDRELSPEVDRIRIIPHALQQVLVNMMLNALDALDGVPRPRMGLATRAENGQYLIEIRDNGHGIPANEINRIFEPFFTTKPVGKGTGLGLSISFSLIQQHGGTCEVASDPGQGTTFTIRLPNRPPSSKREAKMGQDS